MKVLDSVCKGCVCIFTSRECERKLIAAALSVSGEMARQCSSVGNAVGNVVIVLGKVRQCKAMAQQYVVGKYSGQAWWASKAAWSEMARCKQAQPLS